MRARVKKSPRQSDETLARVRARAGAVTAGDASVVGPGRTWKFTTENFAARAAEIPNSTSSH